MGSIFFKCIFKCFCQHLHTIASSHLFPLQCSISSLEEERLISTRRPKTPTSSDFSDLNTQTNWTKSLPLPTPEEKMRQQAQTVQADVVPINITGMLCSAQVPSVPGERMAIAFCLLYALGMSFVHQR